MKPTRKEIIKKAEKIYSDRGQSAVFEYSAKIGIKKYKYCCPCETESPIVDNICLVCGTINK